MNSGPQHRVRCPVLLSARLSRHTQHSYRLYVSHARHGSSALQGGLPPARAPVGARAGRAALRLSRRPRRWCPGFAGCRVHAEAFPAGLQHLCLDGNRFGPDGAKASASRTSPRLSQL